jgi:hypothetical protein
VGALGEGPGNNPVAGLAGDLAQVDGDGFLVWRVGGLLADASVNSDDFRIDHAL